MPANFKCGGFSLPLNSSPYVMGILNITPDSFSDGGKFFSQETAVKHVIDMQRDGAAIIDIGAQSTRPGAVCLSEEEEEARLLPVLDAVVGNINVPVSIDTFYPSLARKAIEHGASIINDITGFEDPNMLAVAKESGCGCVAMFNRTKCNTFHNGAVFTQAAQYLKDALNRLEAAGIDRERICLDPGIGFGMSAQECCEIIKYTAQIRQHGVCYLIGASRKRFIGAATAVTEPEDRLIGTIAVGVYAQLAGANILRVHDVAETVQAIKMTSAITHPGSLE